MKKILLLSVLITLGGCETILDTKVPMREELISNSDSYKFKKPFARIIPSNFDQETGEYTIQHEKVSPKSTRYKKDGEKNKFDTLAFLIKFEYSSRTEIESSNSNRSIEFQVNHGDKNPIYSSCLMNESEMRKSLITNDESDVGDWQRLKTVLTCEYKQKSNLWDLNFTINNEHNGAYVIISGIEDYHFDVKLTHMHYKITTNKSGDVKQRQSYDPNSIVSFYVGDEQVASLLLENEDKLWLKSDIPDQMKHELVTAAYSIILFTWLDSNYNATSLL